MPQCQNADPEAGLGRLGVMLVEEGEADGEAGEIALVARQSLTVQWIVFSFSVPLENEKTIH